MQIPDNSNTLLYVHDPMCSWCWGFARAYDELIERLPKGMSVVRILGGLAPDSDEPMSEDMKNYLSQTWATIQARVPGTEFNFDYWTECQPRRSTYPACRGVIAARQQGPDWDSLMTRGIQHAYYLNARNPSNNSTLIGVAEEIGLDPKAFEQDLESEETQQTLMDELAFSRKMGVQGFPSLVLVRNKQGYGIPVDHNSADNMLAAINHQLAS